MGAVLVGAVLMGAVMALEPEKVLKMNTYRAISKRIFAQLCRQLRFPDDGWGGGVCFFPEQSAQRGGRSCLLSFVFCLLSLREQDTPSGGVRKTHKGKPENVRKINA